MGTMMTSSPAMPAEVRALFERFISLGAMLPAADALDFDDPQALMNTSMVLKEMSRVVEQIDMLAARYAEANAP
jgi:hypothetical protein